jgi:hypothetical protein
MRCAAALDCVQQQAIKHQCNKRWAKHVSHQRNFASLDKVYIINASLSGTKNPAKKERRVKNYIPPFFILPKYPRFSHAMVSHDWSVDDDQMMKQGCVWCGTELWNCESVRSSSTFKAGQSGWRAREETRGEREENERRTRGEVDEKERRRRGEGDEKERNSEVSGSQKT